MYIFIVNVGRIDNDTIMVEFSDESFVTFSAEELANVKRYRKAANPIVSPNLIN